MTFLRELTCLKIKKWFLLFENNGASSTTGVTSGLSYKLNGGKSDCAYIFY